MATHTPGPWHYNDSEGDGLIESPYGLIARVIGTRNPDDETLPNARLIAAAPDLLDSARYVSYAWNDADNDLPADDEVIELRITGKGLRDLRAAIAAAEGHE